MTTAIDVTHDPARRSFVGSANGHADFPIQNLPLGVFARGQDAPRIGIAIGDGVFDLRGALEAGMFQGAARTAAERASAPPLNTWLAFPPDLRRALRQRMSELLSADSADRPGVEQCLIPASEVRMQLPAAIGDYTDFYAGIHHAEKIGRVLRPDTPLLPNYKFVPIGYHARASSVIPSGTDFHRPTGQLKAPDSPLPIFAPTRRLDIEVELGIWIGGGNALGEPIPLARAGEQIAGYCLLNDWSARDIQAWEYQPLGPFLSKNFATSVSPWIVTSEALAPFRVPARRRAPDDPAILPYLHDAADQQAGGLALELETFVTTETMRARGMAPVRVSLSGAQHLYWTPAQLVAHHTSGGCNLRPGDLLGSGTISGPAADEFGSFVELSGSGGKVALPTGETRTYLEDGDEITLRGRAAREGFVSIGFGECRGRVLPAV